MESKHSFPREKKLRNHKPIAYGTILLQTQIHNFTTILGAKKKFNIPKQQDSR